MGTSQRDARRPCSCCIQCLANAGFCGFRGLNLKKTVHTRRLAAVTNANGFVVQYTYDIMDRVTNISWQMASGATLGGFAYEYDALGRIHA